MAMDPRALLYLLVSLCFGLFLMGWAHAGTINWTSVRDCR